MAEVGILNLQIKDNSQDAITNLGGLEGALSAVKTACKGFSMNNVANQIEKIAEAAKKHLDETTTARIEKFAAAMSKLSGLGDISINLKGADRISKTVESIEAGRQNFERIGESSNRAMGAIESGFTDVVGSVVRAGEGVNGAFEPARKAVSSVIEEFKSLEKNKTFQSWMYGPRQAPNSINNIGAGSMIPDEQMKELRPEWYRTEEEYQKIYEATAQVRQETDRLNESLERTVNNGSITGQRLSIDKTNAIASSITELDLYKEKLRQAEVQFNAFVNEGKDPVTITKAALAIQDLRAKIEGLEAAAARAGTGGQIVDNLLGMSGIEIQQMKIDAMTEALAREAETGRLTTQQMIQRAMEIQHQNDILERMVNAENEAADSTFNLGSAFNALKGAISRMFPTFSNLLKRFKSLVKYRMLRAVLKHITEGFREGVENLYHYSKEVGTSFAPAMDAAATSLQQMKNSLGAALSPVIQALIPYLQQLINGFITLVNWVNQFFALMRGQSTWTRALPASAEAFTKTGKAAKGASSAMKDLLADWDELNIIQSQSGGGSGGAASGDFAKDYTSMFEEVNKFEDGVKDVLAFIDDHLGGLTGILKKAGAILLGWKFSKAFEGFLGIIGQVIAGLGLITLGLELSYGGGFEAGKKGYFDTKDLLATIGGAIASALGGSLLTKAFGLGGGIGFAIGLTAAALVTLIGWIRGQEDLADRNKWGNLTMTQDQIQRFVKDQFTFNADAEITVMDAHLESIADAKEKVNDAIKQFNESFTDAEKIVADVDTTTAEQKVAAVKQAALDAQETIEAVKQLIDANEEGLTYTLTNFKFENAGGEDITDDLLNSIKISDKTLSEYFIGQGKKLAELMLAGEKSGWKNGELEAAIELMASQKRIYERAAELEDQLKFETNMAAQMKNVVDRDTALEIYRQQKEALKEYEDTVRETVNMEAQSLLGLAALAKSAAEEVGLDTDQGKELERVANEYKTDAEKILDDVQGAVDRKLKDTKDNMAKSWAETLGVVYGEDLEEIAKNVLQHSTFDFDVLDVIMNPFGNTYSMNPENIRMHGIDETVETIRETLLHELLSPQNDPNGLVAAYIRDFNGKVFNILTKEAKRDLASGLITATGDAVLAHEIFQKIFNLPTFRDADEYFKDLEVYANKAAKDVGINGNVQLPAEVVPEDTTIDYSNTVIQVKEVEFKVNETDLREQLRKEIEDAMADGIMSSDEGIDLMTRYGISEFENMLKELQYNLDEEGMNMGLLMHSRKSASGFAKSDVGYSNASYTPETINATTRPESNDQEVRNTSEGVRQGTASMLEALQSILAVAQSINRKDFSLKLMPNSSWGAHNAKSNAAYSVVTGEIGR